MIKIIKNFWFIPVIIGILIVVNLYVCRLSMVIGFSMKPTLNDGDLLLTSLVGDMYERYDVIVFVQDDTHLVKRVIGLPGEIVQIIDNTIYIDGLPIEDSVDVEMNDYGLASEPIRLSYDEYFVLGDNRNDSIDSRVFGTITSKDILGHAVCRLLPFNEL